MIVFSEYNGATSTQAPGLKTLWRLRRSRRLRRNQRAYTLQGLQAYSCTQRNRKFGETQRL